MGQQHVRRLFRFESRSRDAGWLLEIDRAREGPGDRLDRTQLFGATRKNLDSYLVSVEELEVATGERFPEVPDFLRSERPRESWMIPMGCDKS